MEIKFGIENHTGDIDGEIISKCSNNFNEIDVKSVLRQFTGSQMQTPPMFSALKIKGKPLYSWARKGVFLLRKERNISIHQIDLLDFGYDYVRLRVSCTKGTYIRSLAESIGRALNTKAIVFSLRRVGIGEIKSGDMIDMPKGQFCDLSSSLLPSDFLLKHLSKAILDEEDAKKVRNGQSIDYNAQLEKKGLVRIYTNKSFMGIGELNTSNRLSPRRLVAIN